MKYLGENLLIIFSFAINSFAINSFAIKIVRKDAISSNNKNCSIKNATDING